MTDEKITELETKIKEKDEKLSNQSQELNYLTNDIIPNLKRENSDLKSVKKELSDALEKSNHKYFDQLDINVDLSDKLTKISAEQAVNKVRIDKFEDEITTIKNDASSKIKEYEEKLENANPDLINKLKQENTALKNQLKEQTENVSKFQEDISKIQFENNELRKELIEVEDYKKKIKNETNVEIDNYKKEISKLKNELKSKQSDYDKLYNESQKEIGDLKKQVSKFKKEIDEQSNKGFLSRFSNKS